MNIYKKNKLRNLTNQELEKMLKDSQWQDRDLLREYDERCHDGRIKSTEYSKERFRQVNYVTRSA